MPKNYLPNSFATPNAIVDTLMGHLSGNEYKVLVFAWRHIFGFGEYDPDKTKCISKTMFLRGYTSKKGHVFGGVGMGKSALENAIRGCMNKGILTNVGCSSKGREWTIDLEEIEIRYAPEPEKKAEPEDSAPEAIEVVTDDSYTRPEGTDDIYAAMCGTGFEAGEMTVIAAMTGEGKSSFVDNLSTELTQDAQPEEPTPPTPPAEPAKKTKKAAKRDPIKDWAAANIWKLNPKKVSKGLGFLVGNWRNEAVEMFEAFEVELTTTELDAFLTWYKQTYVSRGMSLPKGRGKPSTFLAEYFNTAYKNNQLKAIEAENEKILAERRKNKAQGVPSPAPFRPGYNIRAEFAKKQAEQNQTD